MEKGFLGMVDPLIPGTIINTRIGSYALLATLETVNSGFFLPKTAAILSYPWKKEHLLKQELLSS